MHNIVRAQLRSNHYNPFDFSRDVVVRLYIREDSKIFVREGIVTDTMVRTYKAPNFHSIEMLVTKEGIVKNREPIVKDAKKLKNRCYVYYKIFLAEKLLGLDYSRIEPLFDRYL